MMNKRAQIAETLTWVAAFLIIFFIMIIFAGSAAILAQGKSALAAVGIGSNKIEIGNIELNSKDAEKNAMALMSREIQYKGNAVNIDKLLMSGVKGEDKALAAGIGSAIGESCESVILGIGSLYILKEKGKDATASEKLPDTKSFLSAGFVLGRGVEIKYFEKGCR